MKTFKYTYPADESGNRKTGYIQAEGLAEARRELWSLMMKDRCLRVDYENTQLTELHYAEENNECCCNDSCEPIDNAMFFRGFLWAIFFTVILCALVFLAVYQLLEHYGKIAY